MTRGFGCAVLALAFAACAGPAASEHAPAPASPSRAVAAAPELGAESVLLFARVRHPAQALAHWGDVSAIALLKALLAGVPSGAAALALDSPIDVVVASTQGLPDAALAAPIIAYDVDATRIEESVARLGLRAEGRAGARRHFAANALFCALEGRRMACGPSRAALFALEHYVLSQLPAPPASPSDVHAELRLAPLRTRFTGHLSDFSLPVCAALLDIQSRNREFDRALAAVHDACSRELAALVQDVDSITADATLPSGAGDAALDISARLSGKSAHLTRWLSAQAARGGPAPDAFWRIPSDCTNAAFINGLNAEEFRDDVKRFGKLFGELLSYQGTPPKLSDLAAELAADFPLPEGALVYGSGRNPFDEAQVSKQGLEARDLELERARWGWRLLSTDTASDRYASYFANVTNAFEDPVLGPQLRRFITAKGADAPLSIRRRNTPAGSGLPQSARLIEIAFPARELDPRSGSLVPGHKPGVRLLLAVTPLPTGEHGLLGLGADEKAVLSRLRSARDHQPQQARLENRDGLSELSRASAIAGGFTSAEALRDPAEPPLPNGGKAPIVYTVELDTAASVVRLRVRAPAPALSDISALLDERRQNTAD